ncbi:hypothetical protein G6L28_06990 [Agrobacterium larrymoorei]|uniref:hypothetical protein n=1 Tax=Agrobacterium larrymoorei TaxID=160699 RepID=UPI001572A8EA|nr:hypothetical protein [Agrobacterium larrymoorei]NTJ42346.1 hypothetical protein [Agrobacterium larrymoorei]
MWQVWSASADAAAYASESIKRTHRAPKKIEVERAAKELVQRVRGDDDPTEIQRAIAALAPSLYLSTSDRRHPQATLEEVVEAYGENEVEEP